MEHTFVTTLEKDAAIARAEAFLQGLGFRLEPTSADGLHAVRGRARPNSRKVRLLPQSVTLVYDRARVTVAASVTPRSRKQLPVYAELTTALARGLEKLLVDGLDPEAAAAEWRAVQAARPTVWITMDTVGVVMLSILGALLALVLVVLALIAIDRM